MIAFYLFGLGMSIWGLVLNIMAGEMYWTMAMIACMALNVGGFIKELINEIERY